METSDEAVVAARAAGRARSAPAQSSSSRATRPPVSRRSPPRTSSSSTRPGAASAPTSPRGSSPHPATHVVYSSCHLGSLARDLAAMPSLRATQARVFDMFPQTTHLETAVLLERR